MSITRFNKGQIFDVKLDGMDTVKLADLPRDTVIKVLAIMFTEKGKFGKSAFLVIAGNRVVYLPKHKVKECEDICADATLVQDIKDGKVGFVIDPYEDETGVERLSTKWVDM